MGRSFVDGLNHPSYGIGDGDTMLWFMTSWLPSAKRIDFKTQAKRYVLGGFGPQQHMGIGMFRSNWASSAIATDAKQVTWGGFYGIGSYIVDHMHNIAGSFWLWRNGEYLLTEPLNYGGNEAATYPFTLWNSLSIPNEAVTLEKRFPDNGGPVIYFNQRSAYLQWGRAQAEQKIFYALLNADDNYDLKENIWAACTGTCRQPVKKYTRSFVYDGVSEVVFLVDRVDLARGEPTGLRFRTQNPETLSTIVNHDTVSVPSEKGNYRTLIRVLTPTTSDPWIVAQEPWAATVPHWQIDPTMVGSQAQKAFAMSSQRRIITVLHIGKAAAGNHTLDNAQVITAASGSLGACALSSCFIAATSNTALRTTVSYTTPTTMVANSRHLVADMMAGACYAVTSSVSGVLFTGQAVDVRDHTLLFTVPIGGAQRITITQC